MVGRGLSAGSSPDRLVDGPAHNGRPDIERRAGLPPRLAGPGLILLLAAVGVLLAFWASGYFPRVYLPVLIFIAALSAVVWAVGPLPRLTSPALVSFGLFAALAAWTALSITWASSPSNAWLETNRTLLYLLGFGLVLVASAWAPRSAPFWLAGAVLAGSGLAGAAAVGRLLSSGDPSNLFGGGGRLSYPISYWNGTACLFVIGAWLALAMASGRWRRWWLEPLLLAIAITLVQLAVLPQSRGAIWSFVIVIPAFVVVAPHRFRSLTNLAILLAATAWSWPRLVAVLPAWQRVREARLTGEPGIAGPLTDAIQAALAAVALSLAVALMLWAFTYALERAVGPLRASYRRWITAAVAVVFLATSVVGLLAVDRRSDGLMDTLSQRWDQFISDQAPTDAANRLAFIGLTGRLELWKVAGSAFREHPLQGVGAQNYEGYFYQHRPSQHIVRNAHSRPMELLAELGLPGLALWLGVLVIALGAGLRERFTVMDPGMRAALAGMLVAVLYWTVHGSTEWFWQLGGVTWPMILLMAGLASSGTLIESRAIRGSIHEPGSRGASQQWERTTLRFAFVALSAAALLSAAMPYLSLRYYQMATTLGDTRPQEGLQAARLAARLDPLSAEPFVAEARIHQQEGPSNIDLAASAWQAALEREPADWVLAYRAGLFFKEADRLAEARRVLERARELNPLNQQIQQALESLG